METVHVPENLIKYHCQRERLIHREVALELPTRNGKFDLFVYSSVVDLEPHLTLTMGGDEIRNRTSGCSTARHMTPTLISL